MKPALAVLCLAAFHLAGCRADNGASSVPLESLTPDPRPAVPQDRDVSLRLVKGMTGSVPHGDELMVMVFGDGSTEADIFEENKVIGDRSLHRYLQEHPPESPELTLFRVPDMDDESGSRYFYYEATSPKELKLIALCVGGPLQNADNPPVCERYHRVGEKTVSYRVEEAWLVRNHTAIAARVLRSLGD